MTMSHSALNVSNIVEGGYCSGCGACAYFLKTGMNLTSYGEYQPDFKKIDQVRGSFVHDANDVCPFLTPELNENELVKARFSSECQYDEHIGYHRSIFGAYVIEGRFREEGTSGGMGTWIATELLRNNRIDGVIHVKPVEKRQPDGPFFKYGISRSLEEIQAGSKTRYHVVEMSAVLAEVRECPGRYFFIGLPCFCKAVRRLQRVDEVLNERIHFVGSLVCGHLKSVNWTLSLGWGAGIDPKNLAAFKYRTKGPNIPARAYVFEATLDNRENTVIQKDSAEVIGGKFNLGAMMLGACDYCDDVVGETADLTIGDAWLPRFDVDARGTNLLIVRNSYLESVLRNAGQESRIHLEDISVKEAVSSQSGGFRHRREGLSYRLRKAKVEGCWTPVKRVAPNSQNISRIRQMIYDARVECAQKSREVFREALRKNDYSIYQREMRLRFKRLRALEITGSLWRIVWLRAQRIFRKLSTK